jgi:hypothetical protein
MGSWFWINMPLAAVIFAAVCGIPLWMVIRHPDTGPQADWPHPEGQHAGQAVLIEADAD